MALCASLCAPQCGAIRSTSRRRTYSVPAASGHCGVGRTFADELTFQGKGTRGEAVGGRLGGGAGWRRGPGVACRSSAAQITALTAIDYGFLGFGALILILIGVYSSRTTDPLDMMNIAESSPEEIENRAKEAMSERMKQTAMVPPAPGDGSAPDKPVLPGSKAEFDALAPGTWFYYPETGKVYQKPADTS